MIRLMGELLRHRHDSPSGRGSETMRKSRSENMDSGHNRDVVDESKLVDGPRKEPRRPVNEETSKLDGKAERDQESESAAHQDEKHQQITRVGADWLSRGAGRPRYCSTSKTVFRASSSKTGSISFVGAFTSFKGLEGSQPQPKKEARTTATQLGQPRIRNQKVKIIDPARGGKKDCLLGCTTVERNQKKYATAMKLEFPYSTANPPPPPPPEPPDANLTSEEDGSSAGRRNVASCMLAELRLLKPQEPVRCIHAMAEVVGAHNLGPKDGHNSV